MAVNVKPAKTDNLTHFKCNKAKNLANNIIIS